MDPSTLYKGETLPYSILFQVKALLHTSMGQSKIVTAFLCPHDIVWLLKHFGS